MTTFAERLAAFRKRAHLTQKEMGALLGVDGNYVYLLESDTKKPGRTLEILFTALEKSPIYPEGANRTVVEGASVLREDSEPMVFHRRARPAENEEFSVMPRALFDLIIERFCQKLSVEQIRELAVDIVQMETAVTDDVSAKLLDEIRRRRSER